MGAEGIGHAAASDLFTSLLFLWAIETLQRLAQGTNTSAAAWLSQQMATLGQKQPQ